MEQASIRRELVEAQERNDFDTINHVLYPRMGERVAAAIKRSRNRYVLPPSLR